ncbi:hypothetical protein Tco_0340739 [Tanacetum coccineum]
MLEPPVVEGEVDEAVFKEWDDRVVRDTTTAASLDAAQASSNITKTQSTAMASKHSYDSPLLGVNTPESDKERLKQHELTDNVPPTPHDSHSPKDGHHLGKYDGQLKFVIEKLKNIVTALSRKFLRSLRSKKRGLTLVTFEDEEDLVAEDPSKQGRILIEEMDLDKVFGDGQEVSTAAQEVSTASPQRNADTTADDLTLTETLMEIKKVLLKIRALPMLKMTSFLIVLDLIVTPALDIFFCLDLLLEPL